MKYYSLIFFIFLISYINSTKKEKGILDNLSIPESISNTVGSDKIDYIKNLMGNSNNDNNNNNNKEPNVLDKINAVSNIYDKVSDLTGGAGNIVSGIGSNIGTVAGVAGAAGMAGNLVNKITGGKSKIQKEVEKEMNETVTDVKKEIDDLKELIKDLKNTVLEIKKNITGNNNTIFMKFGNESNNEQKNNDDNL